MRRMLIVLALAGALFAGCGGDDDEPETAATPAADGRVHARRRRRLRPRPAAAASRSSVAAPESGALEFDPKELTAKAGEVTFDYSNPSGTPHAFEIEGVDGGEERDGHRAATRRRSRSTSSPASTSSTARSAATARRAWSGTLTVE